MKKRTLITLSVFFSSMASEPKCLRSPKEEGWSWINAIEDIEPGNIGKALRLVHDRLRTRSECLQRDLPISDLVKPTGEVKKNLLLCNMSLILKSRHQPSVQKVFYPTSVFENHLFISGDIVPKDPKKQGTTSTWRLLELKDERMFCHTSHIYQAQSGGEKVHIISFNRNQCSDFYDNSKIVMRTCILYKGLPDNEASKKARLARQWMALQKPQKSQNNDAAIIIWYDEASKTPNLHNGSSNSDKTDENFFDGENDSEQKFLYYVNDITDCLADFNQLKAIISKIILFIQCMAPFRAGQIREFMNGNDSSISNHEVRALRENFKDCSFNAGTNKQKVLTVLAGIEATLIDDANVKAKSLKASLKVQPEQIEDKSFLPEIQALSSHISKKNNGDYVTENFQKLKKSVEVVKGIAESIGSISPPSYKDLKDNLARLEEELTSHEFKIEPSILTFEKATELALQENKDHSIETIVLHLHNTYDCCANCAPDLAQELRAEGRFIEYFKNAVREHNIDKTAPRFMILASCRRERPQKWCDTCKKPQHPMLDSDDSTFYQYSYSPNQKEITHKGTTLIDPANFNL